jgi:hypothetical protein
MPEPKLYQFSTHIGALCVARATDVDKLGAKLGMDPMELFADHAPASFLVSSPSLAIVLQVAIDFTKSQDPRVSVPYR